MSEANTNRIIAFVAEFWGEDPGNLSKETRILHDLGIDGVDAVELLEKFSEEFEVDLSNFPYKEYFGDESFNPILWLFCRLLRREKLFVKPFTIGMMVDFAETYTQVKK